MKSSSALMCCNILANISPLADGSLPEEDILTLKEIGRKIRENGYPKPKETIYPDPWTKVKKDKNVATAAE